MSIRSQYEREEELLEAAYERGEMTSAELTKALNDLAREYRSVAQEADAELDRW